MQSNTEKALKYGTYGVAFLIPWITFGKWVFPHSTSKAFLFYGFVSIFTALWMYLLCTDSRYRLSKRQMLFISPLVAYVVWMTVASFAAHNPGLSFWGTLMRGTGLLTLYTTILYALIVASLSKRYEGYVYTLVRWVLAGSALVALSVWLGDEGLGIGIGALQKGSGGGVTGNSTLAGIYLTFTLGFTAFLIATKNTTRKMWLWVLGGIIMCSPLFINIYGAVTGRGIFGSARGAFLGIIAGSVIAVLIYWTLSSKKAIRGIGISGLVFGVLVFIIAWYQLVTPGTTIHQKFIDAASGTRFAFWHIAQQAMHERPLVGYGPENFSIAQARYFNPQFLSKDLVFEAWTDHPHNVYYDNGVAAGYPGVVLYIIFVGSLVVLLYRNKYLTSIQKSILIGTLVGYLFQDLVGLDGFITIWIFGVFTGVVYGTISAPEIKKVYTQQVKSWHPVLLWSLLVIASVAVYYLSYQPASKAKLYGAVLASKLDKRSPRYQEFLAGSPVGSYWDAGGFGYDEYKLYAKDPIGVKQDQKLRPYAIKDVDAYIEYLEEIAKTNKTDYRLYFTIVNFYNTKIYLADLPYDPILAAHMTDLIEYGRVLAPTDPRLYWLYAQLAAWKGDIEGVIASYQQGIAIEPTLPVSHRLLLQFLRGIGNQKLYKESLLYAQKEIPGFILQ